MKLPCTIKTSPQTSVCTFKPSLFHLEFQRGILGVKMGMMPQKKHRHVTTQISRSPKDPHASLGGPERWLGPLYVYCNVVVESRSRRAKKQRQQPSRPKTSTIANEITKIVCTILLRPKFRTLNKSNRIDRGFACPSYPFPSLLFKT